MIISNLTAIFDIIKATWPSGIVFYNEEWTPLNDPTWRDPTGAPYPDKIPDSLDWISYDFCKRETSVLLHSSSRRRVCADGVGSRRSSEQCELAATDVRM